MTIKVVEGIKLEVGLNFKTDSINLFLNRSCNFILWHIIVIIVRNLSVPVFKKKVCGAVGTRTKINLTPTVSRSDRINLPQDKYVTY